MYQSIAHWHAAFWRDPKLIDTTWLKGTPWYRGKERGQWEAGIEFGRRALVTAKGKAGNGTLEFASKLVGIIDESFERASWEALQAHLKNPNTPWALCLGDFHASNMLLRNTATNEPSSLQNGLVMFDWSEVGPWEATMDLAQTIISDVSPSLFVPHSKQLVRHYWETLIAHGVKESDYPFDACWEGFCRGAERWVWVFAVLASMPLLDKATQYFHDQLLAVVEAFGGDTSYYQLKPIVCTASVHSTVGGGHVGGC